MRIVYSPLDCREPRRGEPRPHRSSSSPSASKPRRRPTRWPSGRPREAGADEFQRARLARAGAAGDGGDPVVAEQSRAGVPGAGPRLHGDGLREYEPLADALSRADRRHRLRAGRSAGGRPARGAASSRRAARRSRTPTAAPSAARAIPLSQRLIDEVFEVCDRKWRGIGTIPTAGCGSARRSRDSTPSDSSSRRHRDPE